MRRSRRPAGCWRARLRDDGRYADGQQRDGWLCGTRQRGDGAARLRIAQRIAAGEVGKLAPGTAARIFTGAPIPEGADAIVMQEFCAVEGEAVVVRKVPKPGDSVRRTGSDVRKGDTIVPAGKRLLPQDTGLAASVGIGAMPVYRRVRLACSSRATSW